MPYESVNIDNRPSALIRRMMGSGPKDQSGCPDQSGQRGQSGCSNRLGQAGYPGQAVHRFGSGSAFPLCLLCFFIVFSLAGCTWPFADLETTSASRTAPTQTLLPPPPTSLLTSVSPEPEPSAEPSPVTSLPTESTLPADEQEARDLAVKLRQAPTLSGVKKLIRARNGLKRVVYERDGQYIGEYKAEVTFDGETTGGVALKAAEVRKILTASLKKLPANKRWLIPLPVDISDLQTLTSVDISLNCDIFGIYEPIAFKISFGSQAVSVSNILPKQTKVLERVFTSQDYSQVYSLINDQHNHVITGREMEFFNVFFSRLTRGSVNRQTLSLGDCLGVTSRPVYVDMSSNAARSVRQSYAKILKINACPVFVISTANS